MELETERLILREFQESDWKAVHEYASDTEVVRFMEWGPNTEKDSKEFVSRALFNQNEEPRSSCNLAIITRMGERLIGSCVITVSNLDNKEGWIGYTLNRSFWNQGYATEAAKRLLALGFNQFELHRIFATVDPQNSASVRVLEKIGMSREGYLREHKRIKNRWRDSFLYSILEHEWET